jgi:hypothetical protein
LFLAAAGSERGSGDREITFRFAASCNATGLSVVRRRHHWHDKKSWGYLWVCYADAENPSSKARKDDRIRSWLLLRLNMSQAGLRDARNLGIASLRPTGQ